MENIYSLVAGSCVFFLLLLVWKMLNSAWLKPKRLEKCLRAQGLTGNPYRLLVGDMKEYLFMLKEAQKKPISISDDIVPRVTPFFAEIINKYGNNSFCWFGQNPLVFLMDPELVKEIFVKINRFQKPPAKGLAKLLQTGLISHEGEKWKKHRKILNPVFHIQKLKHMVPAFRLSVSEMLSEWEAIVSRERSSEELDVWPHIQRLTSDALSRTAFGSSYEEGRKIFELLKEQTGYVLMAIRSVYLPGWRFLPTKKNMRMKYIEKLIQDSIREIINKRLKAMKEGKANNDDLLGTLLESNQKEIQINGDKRYGMSIKEVIEECKFFYSAGQETTSTLIVWTLILLGRHQDWQSRAREEVLHHFGRNHPDFEGLNHLKTVNMIFNETMRLYPPVVSLIRKVEEDTKIGTLHLPSGVMVTLPIILLHYDTKTWGEDAKEFKPERFAEGISNASKGNNNAVFLPFGWGPRICIGQNFAMVEAKMALAMILQRFSFHLSTSYSHAPHNIFTLQPQHGAHLILHKL
ncbi:hypothetical protein M9H77_21264 [Catharanthus roseus]|uniref:Uncharacterized protein n=1 Tax=Catharanthus roseus TaxID=4058 RepID=A0ACC0AMV5_CATRO|nr:hypothetical protein M9H77_21264 [Catharanthus roseus]